MTEPQTPTGKRLYSGPDKGRPIRLSDILVIEAEARQQERERLRANVDADLASDDPSDTWTQTLVYGWVMDDILADPEDDR